MTGANGSVAVVDYDALRWTASARPATAAAYWLLERHGVWLTHPEFWTRCVRAVKASDRAVRPGQPEADGPPRIQWQRLARLAAHSDMPEADIAVALSACVLSGFYAADGAELEPLDCLSRQAVFQRDGWRCVYCGEEGTTLDHLVPRSRGGPTTAANLVAACAGCNGAKADRTPAELGWTVRGRRWRDSVHPGAWTSARVADALDGDGVALVRAATYRRDALAARVADLMAAVTQAARVALGLADDDPIDAFDRAVLADATRHLSATPPPPDRGPIRQLDRAAA